jgi:putative flippase GtrA
VGCVGFVVDASILYLAVYGFGAGYYGSRVVSYLAAATTTWYLNRRLTFAAQGSSGWLGEWGRFISLNLLGGAVNYAVYAVVVGLHGRSAVTPVLGVALGSLAGMLVNFFVSKRYVFTGNLKSNDG